MPPGVGISQPRVLEECRTYSGRAEIEGISVAGGRTPWEQQFVLTTLLMIAKAESRAPAGSQDGILEIEAGLSAELINGYLNLQTGDGRLGNLQNRPVRSIHNG